MLAQSRMVGFVTTKSYEGARAFYEGKLGFTFVSQDAHAMVFCIGPNQVRVVHAPNKVMAQGTVLGWVVEDIEAAVDWLKERGVVMEKYSFVQDRERGIFTTGHDRVAWFKDPDGNILSLNQHAPDNVCLLPG